MVERLLFPEPLRQEIIAHAQEGNPDEVCGMLVGRANAVERVYRVRNMADQIGAEQEVFRDRESAVPTRGRRPVHYYMDQQEQLRIINEVWDLGLEVIGYYHSHTHTEARPSPTDVRLAIDTDPLYVLVSLDDARKPVVRAWRITKAEFGAEIGDVTEVPLD